MKKINLVKKEEIPKLILGGVTIYAISWTIIYVSGMLLSSLFNNSFDLNGVTDITSFIKPDMGEVFQVGFLSGIITLLALVLLVIAVAYDEYYFSRDLKGFQKRLFWGASWGLIFITLDLIVGSICFNPKAQSGANFCSSFSIYGVMNIFYWLFVLAIVVLPIASEHYGRAKASYNK